MAKIEGTQNIPSEWLDIYRGNLLDGHPEGIIKKRYPYKLPQKQEGAPGVSEKQKAQRQRWKTAIDNFRQLPEADREKWYANSPPWTSFLWYYNFFIMSSLLGNANIAEGGGGVIKSIQTVTISMPGGSGEGTATITEIDPTKAVVMINGASGESRFYDTGTYYAYYWVTIYPYISGLTTTQIKCKWALPNAEAATISATVIEYI